MNPRLLVSSKEPACEKIKGSYHAEAKKKTTRKFSCRLGIGISHQF